MKPDYWRRVSGGAPPYLLEAITLEGEYVAKSIDWNAEVVSCFVPLALVVDSAGGTYLPLPLPGGYVHEAR